MYAKHQSSAKIDSPRYAVFDTISHDNSHSEAQRARRGSFAT